MNKRNKRKQTTIPRKVSAPPEPTKKRRLWRAGLALAGVASAVVAGMALRSTSAKRDASPAFVPRPSGTLTLANDVAPIIFQHCAPCHRPGQSAPFSLLSYEEVRKKGKLVGEV